jgi:hypothetical protein
LGVILLPGIQYAAADDSDQALINIIKSVERGWETADSTPFRQHFLDFEGARYIESGGQNEGLDDRKIHSRGHETFLFRCVGDDWKVVHTHSSSRPVTE